MNRLVSRIVLAALLGVLLYGGYVVWSGYRAIGASLASFHWSAFVLALGLASANYGLRFLKWEFYLARLGVAGVPKLESLLVFLSGFVLTVTPGKVGEVFKSAVLQRTHGVPIERTAPIVVAERLTDVIGVVVLILVGSAGFGTGVGWVAYVGLGLVVIALSLILWEAPVRLALDLVERTPLAGLVPRLRAGQASLRIVASPTALLWPGLLSVVGWSCEGYALHLLLGGFGEAPPMHVAVFFYATATLAGAVIPTPGGLGVAEPILKEGLQHVGGVAAASATAAMILIRFATLWWAVVVGFLALALLRGRFPSLRADDVTTPAA